MLTQAPDTSVYDPQPVMAWARKRFRLKDRERDLKAIVDIYARWYLSQKHEAAAAETMVPEQADIVLILDSSTSETQERYIAAVSKSEPNFVTRRQELHNDGLKTLSALALGSRIMEENFGMSKEGYNHGEYLSSFSNYPGLWHLKLKDVTQRIVEAKGRDFIEQVALYLGHIQPDKSMWSMGQRRYNSYQAIMPHLKRATRFKMRKAVRDFVGHLDQGALRAMWKARFFDRMAYEWLTGRQPEISWDKRETKPPVYAASSKACKIRQQAFMAIPMLVHPFVTYDRRSFEMTQRLEAGVPLREALNGMFEGFKVENPITKEVMSWMMGKTHRYIDGFKPKVNPRLYHFWHDLTWLKAIPREWRPRNARELDTINDIELHLSRYVSLTGRAKGELLREFMAACRNPGGLPPGFVDLAKVEGDGVYALLEHIHETGRIKLDDFSKGDFFRDVAHKLILPEIFRAAARAGVPDGAVMSDPDIVSAHYSQYLPRFTGDLKDMLFAGMSVVKVCSLSDRWHRHTGRLQVRTGRYEKQAEWGAAFAGVITLPNGVKAKCLNSSAMLTAEGDRMKNCVGGYTYQCVINGDQIISLEAADGSWTTTLQLHEDRDEEGRHYRRGQHEAYEGAKEDALPPEAAAAADLLIKRLKKTPPDWRRLDEIRAPYRKDELLIKIGFDYTDSAACDNAYAAWHGTFRDLCPEATREAFLERTGIAAALRERFAPA